MTNYRAPKNKNAGSGGARFLRICAGALLILALSFVLAACGAEVTPASSEGIVYSGRISFENAPLPGVSVLVNGTEKNVSSADGIFIVRGLESGDKISFALEGYEFIPDVIKVAKDGIYDLHVSALRRAAPPPSDDLSGGKDPAKPDDPPATDPENPEGPDVPDDPDPPVENPKTDLSAPINVSFITKEGSVYLVFALDPDAESLCVDVIPNNARSTIFSADIIDITAGGLTDEASGCRAYYLSQTTAGGKVYNQYVLDVTEVFDGAGAYRFEIISRADTLASSSAISPSYSFTT